MLTIEGMSDGVIVLDARNRIVDLNPAAERITGRTSSQAIGQPATQVIPGQPGLVEPYLEMAAARTEVALGERETGRCYDLHVSPLRDRRGRLTGRLVVLHDVTEQKQAETALRESKKKIESLHDLLSSKPLEQTTSLLTHEGNSLVKGPGVFDQHGEVVIRLQPQSTIATRK